MEIFSANISIVISSAVTLVGAVMLAGKFLADRKSPMLAFMSPSREPDRVSIAHILGRVQQPPEPRTGSRNSAAAEGSKP